MVETNAPAVLWSPDSDHVRTTGLAQFVAFVNERYGLTIPIDDYSHLHAWSIENLGEFWQCVAEFQASLSPHNSPLH